MARYGIERAGCESLIGHVTPHGSVVVFFFAFFGGRKHNVWMNACNDRIAPAAEGGLQSIMWDLWLSGAKAKCQGLIYGEL